MHDRTLETYLHRDAGYDPVLSLTGPRQSCETTLATRVHGGGVAHGRGDIAVRPWYAV